MRGKDLSPDIYPLVYADYKAGLFAGEITAKYSISEGSVTNIVRRMGGTFRQKRRQLSKPEQVEVVRRYQKGESTLELAKMFNVNHGTIGNYLRAHGVELRTCGGTLTPSEVLKAAEVYASGLSSSSASKQLGISPPVIVRSARACGVEIRKRGNHSGERKYKFNERFFAEWSPDMAYVLGFCFADACVDRFSLRICQKEADILEQIRRVIGFAGPYRMTGPSRSIHTLVLTSVKLIRDVVALGVVPKKSLIARAPSQVLYPANFVRGYFDGDGHGGWYRKRNKRVLRIGFTSGSHGLLEDIKALLPCHIGGPYRGKGNAWTLQTTALKDALTLRDWMYLSESSLFISRKRVKLFRE